MQKLFKNIFFKLFPWRGRKQLESPADFFSDSQPKVFRSIFKKRTFCKFCKKISPESFHWNWESSFDISATFFARVGQKNRSVSKNEKMWKQNCSPLKCYFAHVKCSSTSPSKNMTRSRTLPAHFLKMMKKFICFPNQFFIQNAFIDTKNAVLTGRPKFSCWITGNDPKNVPQKMQKRFKNIVFKLFPWRCRKQLESPADFFRTASRKFSTRYSKKEHFVIFAKKFHPKVSIETENPVLTTPLIFLRELVKKIAQCPKMKKYGNKTVLR